MRDLRSRSQRSGPDAGILGADGYSVHGGRMGDGCKELGAQEKLRLGIAGSQGLAGGMAYRVGFGLWRWFGVIGMLDRDSKRATVAHLM